MSLASAVLARVVHAAPCVPDPAYTPTPAITWDNPGDPIDGLHVYWRYQGSLTWQSGDMWDEPCWNVGGCSGTDPNCGAPLTWRCRGSTFPTAPQKHVPDSTQGRVIEIMVRAYNAAGESADSNVVAICMPPLCLAPFRGCN